MRQKEKVLAVVFLAVFFSATLSMQALKNIAIGKS
jgi:hypothetical protein